MTAHTASGISNNIVSLLQAYPRLAVALPHPEHSFTTRDAPTVVAQNLDKLQANDLVTVAERHGGAQGIHRYRTTRAAYRAAQRIDPPTLTPCGHTGVRNLGDGVYTCSELDCSRRFDRETAREVLGG